VVRRLGVPEAEAEDVTQEVFLVAARRLDAYQDQGCPRAWLVAIARQLARHSFRAQLRRDRKARELPTLELSNDPQRALECSEAAAFVNAFLAELDADQALVFALAELEDMSVPEIAASLSVNLNTVYGRLRLARKRFETKVQRMARRER
jgi:RNA polymerase sigma-70 factor (ECF subfamily)